MFRDFVKILFYHCLVCAVSMLFISVMNIPVPNNLLKEGWEIGTVDMLLGILQVICSLLMYMALGYYLKIDTINRYYLVLIMYFCMNCWICININSVSFTLNDPTPVLHYGGTAGGIFLAVFGLLNLPIQFLQWVHKYINESLAFIILLVTSLLPGVCMIIGSKLKLKRFTGRV